MTQKQKRRQAILSAFTLAEAGNPVTFFSVRQALNNVNHVDEVPEWLTWYVAIVATVMLLVWLPIFTLLIH